MKIADRAFLVTGANRGIGQALVVEDEEEAIFSDPMSASMAESWRGGEVKALERENAALLQPEPTAS